MGRPEYTQRKLSDPRDTFRFTTPNLDVDARPIDTFQRVENTDGDLTSLATALATIQPTLNNYVQSQTDLTKANVEKAKADQLKGAKDKPSGLFNVGLGYDQAYEHADSQARTGLWSQELQQTAKDRGYFRDAKTPEEAKQMLKGLSDELWQKHFEGVEMTNTVLASASDLFHATTSKVYGDVVNGMNEKRRENFANVRLINDKLDLKAYADNPTVPPHMVLKAQDSEYENMIKDNPELGMTRDQWTIEKLNSVGATALDIMRDPNIKSLSEKLVKANRVLNVMSAKRVTADGKEDLGYHEILGEDMKPKFKATIDQQKDAVAQEYKLLKEAADEELKVKKEILMTELENKMVLDPNVSQDQLNAELYKYRKGGDSDVTLDDKDMETLRDRKKTYFKDEEWITNDMRFVSDMTYRIETNSGNWRGLRDTVRAARQKEMIKTETQQELLRRINTLENEERSQNSAARSASAAERSAAAAEKKLAVDTVKGHFDAERVRYSGNDKALMGINIRESAAIYATLRSGNPYTTAKDQVNLQMKAAGATPTDFAGKPNTKYRNVSDADLPKHIKGAELMLELDRRIAAEQTKAEKRNQNPEGVNK